MLLGMYFSTVDQFGGESQPVVLPLGEGKIITGLEEVIVGMKPGGKRRALVPPAVGYVDLSLGPQPQEVCTIADATICLGLTC
jgi:hypothetical protein